MTRSARKAKKQEQKKKPRKAALLGFLGYTEEQMKKAIQEVMEGKPVATAAKDNHVPRVSLHYKAKGLRPTGRKMGPETILTAEEEGRIVEWVKSLARAGFCVSKVELMDSVQRFVELTERPNPFQNSRPGRTWFQAFLKRHKDISIRTAQNLTLSRGLVTQENLRNWSETLIQYLKAKGYEDILKDPRRVFNGDETAFFLNPKGPFVLAPKGDKTVYQIVNSDDKECITVLVTANAAGLLAPPLLVFQYERIPAEIVQSVPARWGLGKSGKGWMTGALFYEFICNVFNPWIEEMNIPRPVILFIDGHTSHMTIHASRFCDENGIILVALYPNATHLLQPMDVSVFRALKEMWKQRTHKWRANHTDCPTLKKKDFAPLLSEIMELVKPEIISNGFRKCGLVPWNPEAVTVPILASQPPQQNTPTSNSSAKNEEWQEKSMSSQINNALDVIAAFIGDKKVNLLDNEHFETEDESLYALWKQLKTAASKHSRPAELTPLATPLIDLQANQPPSSPVLLNSNYDNPQVKTISPSEGNHLAPVQTTVTPAAGALLTPVQTTVTPAAGALLTGVQTTATPTAGALLNQNGAAQLTVPSPFKKAFIWPEAFSTQKKKRVKEILPSVVTSQSWRDYHESKAKKKLEFEEQKKVRAEMREQKKNEKEAEKQKKTENPKKPKISNRKPLKKAQQKKKRKLQSPTDSEEEDDPLLDENSGDLPFADASDDDVSSLHGTSPPRNNVIDEAEQPGELLRGLCYTCGSSVSEKNRGFTCDVCEKVFHYKCAKNLIDGVLKLCNECNETSICLSDFHDLDKL